MMPFFKRFIGDERAQDLIEYALIAGFISVAAAIGVSKIGAGVNDTYAYMAAGIQLPAPDAPFDGVQIRGSDPAGPVAPCRSHDEADRANGCRPAGAR